MCVLDGVCSEPSGHCLHATSGPSSLPWCERQLISSDQSCPHSQPPPSPERKINCSHAVNRNKKYIVTKSHSHYKFHMKSEWWERGGVCVVLGRGLRCCSQRTTEMLLALRHEANKHFCVCLCSTACILHAYSTPDNTACVCGW